MKSYSPLASKSTIGAVGLLVLASLLPTARHASAQQACLLPPGVAPPPDPAVTAQQVEDGSASLTDFALAARDEFRKGSQGVTSFEQVAYFGCLVRQEGGPWRSGSTYIVTLTPDGRVFVHSKRMSLSGGQLNPLIYLEILSALGISGAELTDFTAVYAKLLQEPHGPFDATVPVRGLRPGIPGASGYASVYISGSFRLPIIVLTGFDLQPFHLAGKRSTMATRR